MKKSNASNKDKKSVVKKIEVTRAIEFSSGDVAFDLKVDDAVTIYSMLYKEVTSKDGKEYQIINFPQEKGKDGNYYNRVYFYIDEDLKAEIIRQLEEKVDA